MLHLVINNFEILFLVVCVGFGSTYLVFWNKQNKNYLYTSTLFTYWCNIDERINGIISNSSFLFFYFLLFDVIKMKYFKIQIEIIIFRDFSGSRKYPWKILGYRWK